MQAERNPSVHRTHFRSFRRDDVTWVVREADSRGVPGAEGSTSSLLFDSREVIRRAWIFPRNWYQLDESELWAVSERSGRISAKFDAQRRELSATLSECLVSINRAQELHTRAKAALAENRAQRAECRKLAAECRAERSRMREMVESHANQLRTAGLTAEDASLYVASAVRETVAQLAANNDSAQRLESDTNRWCARAYEAA
jgi:hypothetical protein